MRGRSFVWDFMHWKIFSTNFKIAMVINSALREVYDVLRRRERVKCEGRIWWSKDISKIV